MADLPPSTDLEPAPDEPVVRPRLRPAVAALVVILVVGIGVLELSGGFLTRRPAVPAGGTPGTIASPDAVPSAQAATTPGELTSPAAASPSIAPLTPAPSSPVAAGPARSGLIAIAAQGGGLLTQDDRGGSRASYTVAGVVLGFPAWSPDGTRIAAIGQGAADSAIYVFRVRRTAGAAAPPTVLYRSADLPPFYLYWTPDGRWVSFLTDDPANGIALRVAPSDAARPIAQDDPAFVLRRGAPLYFDWVTPERVLLHVGSGSTAFVGQVGLHGEIVASTAGGNGDFRPAVLSGDGRYEAIAAAGPDDADAIVVARPDGSGDHRIAVFGPTAMAFEPGSDSLALIAAGAPIQPPIGFPLGPLRIVDPATGAERTILDGPVVAFFWAPDGRTIAALRVVGPGQGPTAAQAGAVLAGAHLRNPAEAVDPPGAGSAVDLVFVDPATGHVRAERQVQLGDAFVSEILPYFDQYALSHRVWSPDSASIALPTVSSSGADEVVEIPVDGSEPYLVADGTGAFWSP